MAIISKRISIFNIQCISLCKLCLLLNNSDNSYAIQAFKYHFDQQHAMMCTCVRRQGRLGLLALTVYECEKGHEVSIVVIISCCVFYCKQGRLLLRRRGQQCGRMGVITCKLVLRWMTTGC